MSSNPKDRASLCLFTFTDGRKCRTPRTTGHPHFCFYHARKESQARAAETLGNDLNFFLSGEYLSANDLTVALGRIIPAVVRGDIKPRTATTVAYLAQTLLQTIHLAQDEYINAFGTPEWRETIHNAVGQNWKYRHPAPPSNAAPTPVPTPNPAPPPTSAPPPAPPSNCHPQRSEGSAFSSGLQSASHSSPTEDAIKDVGVGLQPGPSPASATDQPTSDSEPLDDPSPSQQHESDSPPDQNDDVADEEDEVNEVDEIDVDFVRMSTQHPGEDQPLTTNPDGSPLLQCHK
jgi:hypothetical protein